MRGGTKLFPALARGVTSSNQERHEGEQAKHRVVDRSRHRVSGCEVLLYGNASERGEESEFCDEQESERNGTHPEPGRPPCRDAKTCNYPSSCHNCDQKHQWCFHQLGDPIAEARGDPQGSHSTKDEAGSEHEREVSYTGSCNLLVDLSHVQ